MRPAFRSCLSAVLLALGAALSEAADDDPPPDLAPVMFKYTQDDLDALGWLNTTDGTAAVKAAVSPRRRTTIVLHLPSGVPASMPDAPYPTALSEDTRVQVFIVLKEPHGAAVLSVIECPKHDPFKILGDLEKSIPKAALAGEPPSKSFLLLPVGPELACGAGRLRYQVAMASDVTTAPEASIRLRPVYRLAATAFLGFDLGHRYSFAVNADKKIIRTRDTAGSDFMVGFNWFPGGYDPEVDKFGVSPFLVFDPASAKDNFAIGLAFRPSAGLSIGLAASLHKTTVLDGLSVGDSFSGDGDIPTRQVWNKDSLGFTFGVVMDTGVFAKIGKALGGS
jgi:hypothetical protein